MIGGTVIEAFPTEGKVYINCKELKTSNTCGIFVADCAKARCVHPGDSVWWQGNKAMWSSKGGAAKDVELKKLGYTMSVRPIPDADYLALLA